MAVLSLYNRPGVGEKRAPNNQSRAVKYIYVCGEKDAVVSVAVMGGATLLSVRIVIALRSGTWKQAK